MRSAWDARAPAALLSLWVVSLHELEHGVLFAERSDPLKGEVLRQWLDQSVTPAFAARTLAVEHPCPDV